MTHDKECPQCRSLVALGGHECPDCGWRWPEAEAYQRARGVCARYRRSRARSCR